MIPIFEQGHGEGIGHSFDTFIKRFIVICEEHLSNGRAKAFAFILYNFHDTHLKEILSKKGGFTRLDRLAGKDLSVFYLDSGNTQLLQIFNEIFLGAFEIHDEYNLPFALFFKVADREVKDIEIVELEQTDLMFAFDELYTNIENYVERTRNESFKKIKPKANKLTALWKTVKKVALEQFIKFLIETTFEGGKKPNL